MKKDYRELYEKIAKSDWFKKAYHNKSLGECPIVVEELEESEDERMRDAIKLAVSQYISAEHCYVGNIQKGEIITWLEKQKDASKAIEAVERIDKYIDEHVANAHDMKDSHPDKKYYRGWDDALGKMAGILQDVYSGEKQKEQKPADDKAFEEWLNDWYQGSKELGGDVVMSEVEFKNWSRGIRNMCQQQIAEKLSKEEYVKRFKSLCDAYEIKLPNREYDFYHLCDDLSKFFIDSSKQKPAEYTPDSTLQKIKRAITDCKKLSEHYKKNE